MTDIDSIRLELEAAKHVHRKDNEYHQGQIVRLRAALEEISNMTLDEPMRGVAKRALKQAKE